MLYEFATVEVRPGAIVEAVKRIGQATPAGAVRSRLLGFWTTEIGRVNELISLWSAPDGSPVSDGLVLHGRDGGCDRLGGVS